MTLICIKVNSIGSQRFVKCTLSLTYYEWQISYTKITDSYTVPRIAFDVTYQILKINLD